ncbi:hypothetical protein F5883DRAFT_639724 [Diaporthe sp. PMI_573]|nr:hypothetical protein F5883DRAFT_639724 [Diaporthaceae sp. PMI_573]
MARVVCRGIKIIDKLDRLEAEEAEAEHAWIAEQFAEATCRSSIEEAGRMVAQEAWLHANGDIDVPGVEGVGGNVAAGSLLKS